MELETVHLSLRLCAWLIPLQILEILTRMAPSGTLLTSVRMRACGVGMVSTLWTLWTSLLDRVRPGVHIAW